MSARHRKDLLVPFLTVLSDAVGTELAFISAYWLRFYSPLTDVAPVTKGYPPLEAYVLGSLFTIPAWLFLFGARGLYRPRRAAYFSDEFFAILRVVFAGLLIIMAAAFFYRTFSYSRLVVALIGFTAIVWISAGRYAVLKFEQWWYRRGRDLQTVIVVGSNMTARRIADRIAGNPSLGYRVLGSFSDDGRTALNPQCPHLGSLQDVPRFIVQEKPDLVLLTLTHREHPRLVELVRECEGLNTDLMMVPDMLELMTSRVRIRELEGIPFIPIKHVPLSSWNAVLKRGFDIVVAVLLIILLSPLFAVTALLIRLTSPGPVFYIQERVGLDGVSFPLIKFRSMRTDAERQTGPVWAQKQDPRATPIGRFLRRFSIDELPQLVNVLRGDMSLVGPRPERPHFVQQFRREVPKYMDRHRVRSGMTGWAQVNGLRGSEASIEERTKLDIYYIENWSLIFDLKIIFKTVRAVFFGKDAH